MATLLEGREYGLASNDLSHDNKTLVYFKLTDTALKTLEELSKVKNVRTSIQFHGADGVIKIPSYGNQPERVFQISLSALAGDLNASFDCIQQTSRSHGESSLLSLGTMQNRITVLATDDVFDRTRAKMSKADEENKKVCTKEIKPSGRHISKKIKKVLSSASLKAPHLMKAVNSVHSSAFAANRPHMLRSSSPPPSGLSSSSNSSSSNSLFTQGQNRPPPNVSNIQPASTKLSTTANTPSRVLTSSAAKQFSGSINMPYRDRIIHLLALKPYKKPELILRLQKDGIREKDKNSLGSVLQQVGVMNKDNSYTLARSAWADVRQDWPFYTEQDRVLLKKNLQQESRATPTSPAVSPASSNPESPGSSQKRTSEESEDMSNPNKKKRISHMDKRQEEEQSGNMVKPGLDQQSSPTADRENLDGNTEEVSDDKPDYMRKFVQIEDTDQRRDYKQEFNREYIEYRELHEQVDIVARKFQNLRTQINQTEEGSPDFEALKKEVLEEYEAQKSDPKFMDKKHRMDYLHHKLSHIKRLIHDYDQRLQTFDGS